MLVLTRKVGDVIAIGDNIKIVVMAIKGKQVRLGVQADRNTIVHREEVYQKIQKEIRAAMTSDVSKAQAAGDLLRTATASAAADSGTSAAKPTKPTHCIIRRSGESEAEEEEEGFEDDDEAPVAKEKPRRKSQ